MKLVAPGLRAIRSACYNAHTPHGRTAQRTEVARLGDEQAEVAVDDVGRELRRNVIRRVLEETLEVLRDAAAAQARRVIDMKRVVGHDVNRTTLCMTCCWIRRAVSAMRQWGTPERHGVNGMIVCMTCCGWGTACCIVWWHEVWNGTASELALARGVVWATSRTARPSGVAPPSPPAGLGEGRDHDVLVLRQARHLAAVEEVEERRREARVHGTRLLGHAFRVGI